MPEILTAAQMKALEQAAIESGAVTGLELMERAGKGVVEAIFEEWPEIEASGALGPRRSLPPRTDGATMDNPQDISQQKKRAVVLYGPGNNGGDGFVVARLLHQRGWEVAVFLYGNAEKLPPDARVNYDRWCEIGEVGAFAKAPKWFDEADLYIDALFGTGLGRPLCGEVLVWVTDRAADPRLSSKTVSIDVPSGMCSDSGRDLGKTAATVLAGLTVSFHAMKIGHVLSLGPDKSGKTVVKDIGLPHDKAQIGLFGGADKDRDLASKSEIVRLSKKLGLPLRKHPTTHKYSHGHALILSGSSGHTGAARLAARGALRIGAGLVTLGVPAEAQQEVASQITAIMMCQIGEARALAEVLKDDRMNALCLGPGLGLDRARELVPVALKAKRATVLDADALTCFAHDPSQLFGMLHEACVLTPHAGEFSRLFPDVAAKLNAPATKGPAYSKVDATREAAARAGCVVLFKGADTVIAAPDGRCALNSAAYDREAPWLATAGSGDVLAGFVTGLMARGIAPMQAAETAAWLHVESALEFGPGLIAEDLPEQMPAVFRKLGL